MNVGRKGIEKSNTRRFKDVFLASFTRYGYLKDGKCIFFTEWGISLKGESSPAWNLSQIKGTEVLESTQTSFFLFWWNLPKSMSYDLILSFRKYFFSSESTLFELRCIIFFFTRICTLHTKRRKCRTQNFLSNSLWCSPTLFPFFLLFWQFWHKRSFSKALYRRILWILYHRSKVLCNML